MSWWTALKGRSALRAKAALALAVLGGCFSLNTCGVEHVTYLDPVTAVTVTSNTLGFINMASLTSAANDVFEGYVVLYKIYNYESDATSDYSAVVSANESSPTTLYTKLTDSLGYTEFTLADHTKSPIITKADVTALGYANSSAEIIFNFANLSNVILNIGSSQFGSVYRSVLVTNTDEGTKVDYPTIGKKFSVLEDADADTKINSATSSSIRYLQAFALTYGYDADLNQVYSTAAWLGKITIHS
jgi:hypothetical protein